MRKRISLKSKINLSFLAVVLAFGLFSAWFGVRLIGREVIKQARDKVRLDLNSAWEVYLERIRRVEDVVRLTIAQPPFKQMVKSGDREGLMETLQEIMRKDGVEWLTVTDSKGLVILRSHNPEVYGDSLIRNPFIKRALQSLDLSSGTAIIPREELLKEDEGLAQRAFIETESGSSVFDGMVIAAAAPIIWKGEVLGVLYGGMLLNKSYEIVDRIKNIVYQGEIYKGRDVGTATIFMNDVRISTNVRKEDGTRAIGTRVSKEVRDQVFLKGRLWIGKALVAGNCYIAAYDPIRDIKGKIIGMLYVGALEEKFLDLKRSVMRTYTLITLSGMALAFMISYFLTTGIVRPIKRLARAAHEIARGDLSQKVEGSYCSEIYDLVEAFNMMTESLKNREEKLKEAQEQVMRTEKLAALGQLAAGIAHEINNPLGGILIYSHLLLEDMPQDNPARENIQRIIHEATRCRDIVRGLLEFARRNEPKIEPTDVNRALHHALALVENQSIFRNIEVVRMFHPNLPPIMADPGQLEQAFVNIIINAAEAMEVEGGTLTIETKSSEDGKHVIVRISDTGPGIPPEYINRIFEPFFTTKQTGKGTGLGLSVTYGIIRRHGGSIEVESEMGMGTTFTITLPLRANRGDSSEDEG
ncbi:cache domain-containing protein [Candidatus Poribacteria bacterium]|nr:cache domain-containing protein [Candidatus Poribacteria bacterium]